MMRAERARLRRNALKAFGRIAALLLCAVWAWCLYDAAELVCELMSPSQFERSVAVVTAP